MNAVYVIEHGSDPRPARITATGYRECGAPYIQVDFIDERGGWRKCEARSVHRTKAGALRAEKEMEAASHATANRSPAKSNDELRGKVITTEPRSTNGY